MPHGYSQWNKEVSVPILWIILTWKTSNECACKKMHRDTRLGKSKQTISLPYNNTIWIIWIIHIISKRNIAYDHALGY